MAGEQMPAHRATVSVEQVRAMLRAVVAVPRPWWIVVTAAAVLSCIEASRATNGDWSLGFAVSNTTVLLLALIWVPALVRAIALSGGAVKTPAGEASTGGFLDVLDLLDPAMQREALPSMIAVVEQAEAAAPHDRRAAASDVREQLERELERVEPAGPVIDLLRSYAAAYERIRAAMPPGNERTLRMNQLVVQARAAVAKGTVTAAELRTLFAAGEGGRVMALAAWQARPELADLASVLDAIGSSRSAFEQYHGLRVAERLELSAQEREQLRATLRQQLADPDKGVAHDRSRYQLIQRLLSDDG